MSRRRTSVVAALALSLATLAALAATPTTPATQPGVPELPPPEPVPLLTPEEELATFTLPPGLKAEIVAFEPMVEHPVFVTFDENGRLWVAEMRSYMPDVDGWREEAPTGRVSVLEDLDGDGRMDKSTVFLDGLVLPRAIGFAGGGVLIGSPPNLYFCRDNDGDLKADEKHTIANDFGVVNNPENYANGLLWGIDNWMYNADDGRRLRHVEGNTFEWGKIPVLGQWGISRDDVGRLYFNTNSDHLRSSLVPPHYSSRNPKNPVAIADSRIAKSQAVWPAHAATINRGYRPGMLTEDGRLKDFTAACSPLIYRSTLLGDDFYGNAFVCEATSNFVRRSVIKKKDATLDATNAYDGKEFLTSTYERFRPVSLATGPEGALYVVDMHHGLIQHKISLTEYAKQEYLKKKLNKHLKTGRIFRIVPEKGAKPVKPNLGDATGGQLVELLAHPEGWWRDTAQRLLVTREDGSVGPALRELARNGASPVHRINALWTLDGNGQLEEADVRAALADADPKVRQQAIRLSEPMLAESESLLADVLKLGSSASASERLQLILTLGELPSPAGEAAIAGVLHARPDDTMLREAAVSGLAGREVDFLRRLTSDPAWAEQSAGRARVITDVARSLTRRHENADMIALTDLIGSLPSARAWQQVALLDSVPATRRDAYGTAKPIDVPERPASLAVIETSATDAVRKQAAKVDALFHWPGKPVPPRPKPKPLTAREQELRELGRQQYALICAQCHQPDGHGQAGKAPSLVNSPWVLGSENRLIRIVLHGMRGPVTVNDEVWNMDMPSWGALTDEQIAGVLTYVRREWGHEAPAIDPATVHNIRDWNQARRDGWTEEELLGIR